MKIDNPDLEQLYKLFQKYKTLSCARISQLQDTYAATAKRRVTLLRKQGVRFKSCKVREGERGPLSMAWTLEE